MAVGKSKHIVDRINDVGDWGEKPVRNSDYQSPLMIAGEPVDIDSLPAFGSDENDNDDSTPDGSAKVPVAPGSPPPGV